MSGPAAHEQVHVLTGMPSLSKLYVNAAAAAAKSRVLGGASHTSLPPRCHEVRGVVADLAKMTEYQHLLGKPARDVMPSGFIHAMAFPVAMSVMVSEDFPLPLLGMIHLKNRVRHLGPVLYTQPVSIRSWARRLSGHRAGTQVEVVVEVRADGSAELLWRGVSTYLAKGVFLPGVDKPAAPGVGWDAANTPFNPPDPTALWRLGVDAGRAYAAVSGDFNPIHLSVLSAKVLGMRRSLAHGMYLAARVLSDVGSPEPDAFSWEITFEAPVFLPASVAVHITDTRNDDGLWQRSEYVGWNVHSGRRHFCGSVAAL
ncbi:MaoC family dehydratase [Arthrobacter sp. H14-L1]|uniref:MaoC family dehydratase n=1 Tax=Arthrobacter sp. H14-L1 TaxID=2996697 RepID=UPI00226F0DF7|nr:MaoC/PaaZ C-terminal domain-containing protein [Arthrobacter sp. H14-L1]MCY0906472.1 MaoC/PaaZ C-terminal domain-containing protein [Arthrobacter sp. H14-L1]